MDSKFLRLLGSNPVVFPLVGLLAGGLAASALRGGAAPSAAVLLQQPWLLALLCLLALHLTVRLLGQRPWGWPVVGLALASIALDLLVIGAIVSRLGGVGGDLRLAEGAAADSLAGADRHVRVDGSALLPVRPGASLRLADGATVHLLHWMPGAREHDDVRTDGTTPDPALHFRLGNQETIAAGWLMARHPALSHQTLGPLLVRFQEVDALPPVHHAPTLYLDLGRREFAIPIDQIGVDHDLAGTGYQVRIVAAWHSAAVEHHRVVESKSPLANPAVAFDLVSSQGVERHAAFARFPQFPTYQGSGAPASGVQARYDLGDDSAPVLGFYRLPDGALYARMPHQTVAVKPGRPFATPWMDMKVTVDQVADRARAVVSYLPAPDGEPVVLLSCGKDVAWAPLGQEARLGAHRVRFEAATVPLGFSVRLDRLQVQTDPGTSRAVRARADLTITDRGRVVTAEVTSDEALRYRGYAIALPIPDARGGSPLRADLQVERDPGAGLRVAGGWLLLLAVLWTFYGEPVRQRRRLGPAAERQPLHAAPMRPQPGIALLAAILVLGGASAARAKAPAPVHGKASAGWPASPAAPPAGHPTLPAGHLALPGGLPSASAPPARRGLDLAPVRALAIQFEGRVDSFDAVARTLVRRVTGTERFAGRDPVDLVLSWVADGPQWARHRMVAVPERGLRRALGLNLDESRFADAFLADNARLQSLAAAGRRLGDRATPDQRAAERLQDRLTLLGAAFSGRILTMVPAGPDPDGVWLGPTGAAAMDPACARTFVKWLVAYRQGDARALKAAVAEFARAVRKAGGTVYPAAGRMELEVAVGRAHLMALAWIGYALALLAMVLALRWPRLRLAAVGLAGAGFLLHTAGLVARVAVDGQAPLAGRYEVLAWAAWCAAAAGLVLARRGRSASTAVAAAALAGAVLFCIDRFPLWIDPALRPLAPPLRGHPALELSLLLLAAGSAVLVLAMVMGMAALASRGDAAPAAASLAPALRVGVVLLSAGLVTGGGSFPPIWPLVTVLGCLLLLRGQSLGWIARRGLAAGSAAALVGAILTAQQVIASVQIGRGGFL